MQIIQQNTATAQKVVVRHEDSDTKAETDVSNTTSPVKFMCYANIFLKVLGRYQRSLCT